MTCANLGKCTFSFIRMRVDCGVNTDMDPNRSFAAMASIDRQFLEADYTSLMKRANERISVVVREQVRLSCGWQLCDVDAVRILDQDTVEVMNSLADELSRRLQGL
jgi:hypothetical protein